MLPHGQVSATVAAIPSRGPPHMAISNAAAECGVIPASLITMVVMRNIIIETAFKTFAHLYLVSIQCLGIRQACLPR